MAATLSVTLSVTLTVAPTVTLTVALSGLSVGRSQIAGAEERLRKAADAGDDETELAAALEHAEEVGVSGHLVWMSQTALSKLQEARIAKEEAREGAAIALEVSLESDEPEAVEAALEEAAARGVDEATIAAARVQVFLACQPLRALPIQARTCSRAHLPVAHTLQLCTLHTACCRTFDW